MPDPVTTEKRLLYDGQRLEFEDFWARYCASPDLTRVELIDGVVHMASPMRSLLHGNPYGLFGFWLQSYCLSTPRVETDIGSTVRLSSRKPTTVEPDCLLYILPECGGLVQRTEDDYLEGPPELIIEIAASTVDKDLGSKFELYRRNGVPEYLVYRSEAQSVDWFVLKNQRYRSLAESEDGILKSIQFPGLWLDLEALRNHDRGALLKTLQSGIASPEHAEFVAQLAARWDTMKS
jgi:Uma2 family endonuclease